jgi:uncharacterized protein
MNIVKPKTLILYHAECLDGFISAWIAREALGKDNVVTMPRTYFDAVPDLSNYDNVYILDFSWEPEILLPAIVDVKYVVMLDHHATAIEKWNGRELPENMRFIHNLAQSGIGLTWDFFHSTTSPVPELPRLLALCQHRDLWHKHVDNCMEVGAALYSTGYIKGEHFDSFTSFEGSIRKHPEDALDMLIIEGGAILRAIAQNITTVNARCGSDIYLQDKVGRLININYEFASQCGDMLCADYDFAVMYEDLPELKQRKYSLRSRKGGWPILPLAEIYGGGGHDHAAGFYTDMSDPVLFTS